MKLGPGEPKPNFMAYATLTVSIESARTEAGNSALIRQAYFKEQ